MKIIKKLITLIICATFLLSGSYLLANSPIENAGPTDPLGLVLTWQQDPTTTMTIDWHTIDEGVMAYLEYKKVVDDEWKSVLSEQLPYPYSDRIINRVELTGLEADTEYHFRFGEQSRIRKFRTMPLEANRPIRFIAGGDVRHRIEWMDQTNRRAAQFDPDFVVWGGDLAYANGLGENVDRWYEFMDSIMNTLITADGRAIPVLTAIGNHEVLGGRYNVDDHDRREGIPPYSQNAESRASIAPYYYGLFAFPGQPGYGVLDFGNYMSIILLDTDHSNPIEGEQTSWLEEVLADRKHVPHLIPNYHVPGYPSVRNFDEEIITIRVRENWVPLFEKYGVRVAFESHDHAYKRTFPILENQKDPNGVVYIGDGAWGVNTRPIGGGDDPEQFYYHDNNPWYLNRASSERHFIVGTIHWAHQHFLVVNETGEIIDEYPQTPTLEKRNLAPIWPEKNK